MGGGSFAAGLRFSGETLEELRGNIRKAIQGWLSVEEPQQTAADQVIEVAV